MCWFGGEFEYETSPRGSNWLHARVEPEAGKRGNKEKDNQLHVGDTGAPRVCAQVIVVTGTYGKDNARQGVRYMSNGLKVYYCPMISFHNQATVPTLLDFFPLFRQVWLPACVRVCERAYWP